MFIGHKANTIIGIGEVEWMCRSTCKRLYTPEYWTWVATITSGDPPVVDYSGETGYTIVECSDEDVQARLNQLGDYQSSSPETGTVYNITWSDSKVSAVTGQDIDGNDIVIQTHFSGNDSDKNARLLADKWTAVRRERDRRLSQTDYLALSDNTVSGAMQIYRQKLRDVPAQSDVDDITWPIKP
jgi:hypothetical protein